MRQQRRGRLAREVLEQRASQPQVEEQQHPEAGGMRVSQPQGQQHPMAGGKQASQPEEPQHPEAAAAS